MNKRNEAFRSMVEKVLLMSERYKKVWGANKNNSTGNKQIAELDEHLDIKKTLPRDLG